MRTLNRIWMVTVMNLRSVPQRLGTSFVIVIGMAGVVGVLISMLAMVGGLRQTLVNTGSPDRAVVLRNSATAEINSGLTQETVARILAAPGIARTAGGDPAVTTDMIIGVNHAKLGGSVGALTLRGVSPANAAVRPQIRIVEGRMFEPGLREMIIGRSATNEYADVDIGMQIELREDPWDIVGIFESGDSIESGLLTDTATLLSASQRVVVSSATALLESADAYEQFADTLTTDPTIEVQVQRETDYYAQQGEQLQSILSIVSNVVAGIMAVGALFAALNSMYSAVSTRTVEIATLRAIGFGSASVVISILVEAMLLAIAGALLGALCAWALFGDNTLSMGNIVSSIVFQVRVTPALVVTGIVWACIVGFLGGLLPAWRAARQPVAEALRAV
ncbi:MAG TPA: FtsX-like permease family protein [Gammaproteobacteria bacterium]|nr:FtsX-like permease family protein [Gammaproteobacteria bacterium]